MNNRINLHSSPLRTRCRTRTAHPRIRDVTGTRERACRRTARVPKRTPAGGPWTRAKCEATTVCTCVKSWNWIGPPQIRPSSFFFSPLPSPPAAPSAYLHPRHRTRTSQTRWLSASLPPPPPSSALRSWRSPRSRAAPPGTFRPDACRVERFHSRSFFEDAVVP
jgi:hypothetical protein